MCDERERLIAYVYGEAATSERQEIETHLGECHVCRAEVSGLRSVRDDLLAWDVPKHEPIWRPFVPAPAPAAPMRSLWPSWALAAAAGALFTAGLAGGMAVRGWTPGAPATSTVASVAPAGPTAQAQNTSAVTTEDLVRMEAAILARVRNEMTERMRASAPQAPASSNLARVSSSSRPDETEARLVAIEQWMDDQISLNALLNGQLGRLNSRTSSLSEKIELSRLQRVGLDGGSR